MTLIGIAPIIAAGIASVVLAWLWYAPFVFGGIWMRAANVTPEMAEKGKKRMHLNSLVALVGSMLIAWVMGYVGTLLNVYDWFGAIELGFWCWLGFTAAPMLGLVLWEQRPLRYYFIVAGYWLVAFIVMALVLVVGTQLMSGGFSQYETGVVTTSS